MHNLTFLFHRGNWRASLAWHYVSKVYNTLDNSDTEQGVYGSYDPVDVLDAKIIYALTEHLKLSLAVDNLAGLCNPAGNVLALMPHPERASWLRQVPADLPDHYGQRRREATGNWAALEEPGPGRALFEALKRFGEA